MIPPARDPRMDRPRSAPPQVRSLLVVPEPGGVVRELAMAEGQLATWRRAARLAVGVLVLLTVGVALMLPRVLAHSGLMAENDALRARLFEVERRMGEVDRMVERLRLYDAQIRSLTHARGSFGPLPESAMSNTSLLRSYGELPAITPSVSTLDELPVAERPAEAWAAAVQARVASFVDVFSLGEADLNALMADIESLRAVRDALPRMWPAHGQLTSGFGWRSDPVHGTTRFHAGIDIANDPGTPIHAVAAGRVVAAGDSSGYGRAITIDHGFGITTVYAHCTTLRVREGDLVKKGDYIATMGSTGKSTGPHLHFELRIDESAHDPIRYLPR